MSTGNNIYEDPDFAQSGNSSSRMDITQPTSQPEYDQVTPAGQPASVVITPPYLIKHPSERFFPTVIPSQELMHPNEAAFSLPHPTNNQDMFQTPPPMYNPEFAGQMSNVSPQPMMFPSPEPTMINGMMPPPGPVFFNTAPPMVVTSQTTVISTQTTHCRDYLGWSIFNLICCCFIFGIVALIFSIQTRSAKRYQDWEDARKKSRVAFGFNLAALLLGLALIIIIPSVYYTVYYKSYSYSYIYYG